MGGTGSQGGIWNLGKTDTCPSVIEGLRYPGCQRFFFSLGAIELTDAPRRWRARRPLASRVGLREMKI